MNYGISKAFIQCGIAISSQSLGITISIGVSDFLIQFTGSPEPTARISKVGSRFLYVCDSKPLILNQTAFAAGQVDGTNNY